MEKYLDRLNPKLVVFDVYPKVFGLDGVESALDLIANDDVDAKEFELAARVNNIKTYNTLLYSFVRQKLSLNAGFKQPVHHAADTYIAGGYVESYKQYRSKRPITKGAYVINQKQKEAFERIIENLKKRKIPYVLIQSPISKKLYSSISNNAEMDKLFSGYGAYHNFNTSLSFPDSLFFDDNHLNQNGVNIFDKKVIDQMHLQKNASGKISLKL
ncbi:hypothetical protein [Mucilaginibacter terrae]|nr:hypothetical protein [Mucilaginibacter terrae]